MTELIWEGKYDDKGRRAAPPRIALPFQTVPTVEVTVRPDLQSAGTGGFETRAPRTPFHPVLEFVIHSPVDCCGQFTDFARVRCQGSRKESGQLWWRLWVVNSPNQGSIRTLGAIAFLRTRQRVRVTFTEVVVP